MTLIASLVLYQNGNMKSYTGWEFFDLIFLDQKFRTGIFWLPKKIQALDRMHVWS